MRKMTEAERISYELTHWRATYRHWAQQDGYLTRDEYSEKCRAEKMVQMLECALNRRTQKA